MNNQVDVNREGVVFQETVLSDRGFIHFFLFVSCVGTDETDETVDSSANAKTKRLTLRQASRSSFGELRVPLS